MVCAGNGQWACLGEEKKSCEAGVKLRGWKQNQFHVQSNLNYKSIV